MSLVQISNSSSQPSIPFSILDLKAQAVRLPISKAAQILLSELLTWSGEKGYCWWAVPKIAKDLGWSVSSVWRKSKELQKAGLLEVIPRAGRSNFWVPLPGSAKIQRIRSELTPLAESRGPSYEKKRENLKRCTVPNLDTCTEQPSPPSEPNVNAIKTSPVNTSSLQGTTHEIPIDSIQKPITVLQTPPQSQPIQHKSASPVMASKPKTKVSLTPEQIFLVEEIERATGDTWSRGHFINLVRQTDEQTIYAALSVTREKKSLESGVNMGAYFTSTLKGMTGLASLGARPVANVMTQPSRPTHISIDTPPRPTTRFVTYEEPDPEPLDTEALRKGFRLQYKGAGLESMLSLVQRCVPLSVDPSGLWVDVRNTFPGMEESILIDRFLDTLVTRAKHAEKRAEVAS